MYLQCVVSVQQFDSFGFQFSLVLNYKIKRFLLKKKLHEFNIPTNTLQSISIINAQIL